MQIITTILATAGGVLGCVGVWMISESMDWSNANLSSKKQKQKKLSDWGMSLSLSGSLILFLAAML